MSFEKQLELVQSLANPHYLSHLAQTGYFEDERFLNYLDYLRPIWTSPEYARFISYPASLTNIHLLRSQEFRRALVHREVVDLLVQHLSHTKVSPKEPVIESEVHLENNVNSIA